MPIEHTVRQGECISSIAEKYGLFPDTIWNDPANRELKSERKDLNILHEGDVLVIPDKNPKQESRATEQRHRFRRKGTPAFLRIQILRPVEREEEEQPADEEPADEEALTVTEEDRAEEDAGEEPWANAPYLLDIDGAIRRGETDGDGKLEEPIPPGAQRGRLTMEPGTERETVYTIRLGHLDPVSQISGVADRLNNLGYHDGSRPAELTSDLAEALREFQRANGLQETGEPDQATRDKLRELHGS